MRQRRGIHHRMCEHNYRYNVHVYICIHFYTHSCICTCKYMYIHPRQFQSFFTALDAFSFHERYQQHTCKYIHTHVYMYNGTLYVQQRSRTTESIVYSQHKDYCLHYICICTCMYMYTMRGACYMYMHLYIQ